MVNQTDRHGSAIDGNATNHTFRIVPSGNVCKGQSVYNTEILHLQSFYRINFSDNKIMGLRYAHLLFTALGQYAIDMGGKLAFFIAQQGGSAAA